MSKNARVLRTNRRVWNKRWCRNAVIALLVVVSITGCSQMSGDGADEAFDESDTVTGHLLSTQQSMPVKASSASFLQSRRRTSGGRPIALINDHPIGQREFLRRLIDARGLPLLQQMLLCEIARQEAEQSGVDVTERDINREYDITLQGARFNGKHIEALTPARREQLIEEWTRTRGIAREELAVAMERQTYLRKIVEGRVEVGEEMLKREFERAHGEKVEVRHIQLAARRVYPQVKQRLSHGDRFEDLVADYSQNLLSREKRGLLPPFTSDDPTVPAIFAKVAFEMKPGEVSNPIEAEGSIHVLKLERRIPAENVTFDAARQTLHKNLQARLIAEGIEALGNKLLHKARIRIEDRTLRDQYKRRRASGQIDGPALISR